MRKSTVYIVLSHLSSHGFGDVVPQGNTIDSSSHSLLLLQYICWKWYYHSNDSRKRVRLKNHLEVPTGPHPPHPSLDCFPIMCRRPGRCQELAALFRRGQNSPKKSSRAYLLSQFWSRRTGAFALPVFRVWECGVLNLFV